MLSAVTNFLYLSLITQILIFLCHGFLTRYLLYTLIGVFTEIIIIIITIIIDAQMDMVDCD